MCECVCCGRRPCKKCIHKDRHTVSRKWFASLVKCSVSQTVCYARRTIGRKIHNFFGSSSANSPENSLLFGRHASETVKFVALEDNLQ